MHAQNALDTIGNMRRYAASSSSMNFDAISAIKSAFENTLDIFNHVKLISFSSIHRRELTHLTHIYMDSPRDQPMSEVEIANIMLAMGDIQPISAPCERFGSYLMSMPTVRNEYCTSMAWLRHLFDHVLTTLDVASTRANPDYCAVHHAMWRTVKTRECHGTTIVLFTIWCGERDARFNEVDMPNARRSRIVQLHTEYHGVDGPPMNATELHSIIRDWCGWTSTQLSRLLDSLAISLVDVRLFAEIFADIVYTGLQLFREECSVVLLPRALASPEVWPGAFYEACDE
jgi:hypothetical protein